jgi:hypothetical protein
MKGDGREEVADGEKREKWRRREKEATDGR